MPAYDFRCEECGKVKEYRIPLSEYDNKKDKLECEDCQGKMKRMVDCSATFALQGSGWFGKDGEGTGYEITQTEMDRNLEESQRQEEYVQKQMVKDGMA